MTRSSQPRGFRNGPALRGATLLWLGSVIWAAQSGVLSALGLRFMPGFALLAALIPLFGVALSGASHIVAPHTLSKAHRS